MKSVRVICVSSSRVHLHLAVPIKREDIVRLRVGSIHPRSAVRHAGHGETGDWRFFFQQTEDEIRRDVALENVVLRDRGVT